MDKDDRLGSTELYHRHMDRVITQRSVKCLEELHDKPKLKDNVEISQIKWPKLGSLSFLKPMIAENYDTTVDRLTTRDDNSGATVSCTETTSLLIPRNKRPPANCLRSAPTPASSSSLSNFPHSSATQNDLKSFEPQTTASNEQPKRPKQFTLSGKKMTDFQLELYSLLTSYKDLIYTSETTENIDDIQKIYTLHVLNHLMNARSTIISNNKVFEKKTLSDNIIHDDPKLRDQGFTRARILFLLPFRHSALKLGKTIIELLGKDYNISHLDRFIAEFGEEEGIDSTLRPVPTDGNKPNDYYQTFHGNIDDAFRIGLKLTKKSLKFFADFYDSDIIIASPLGLKTIISPDESQLQNQNQRRPRAASARFLGDDNDSEQIPASGDVDFLSSIEIVVLDQADIFLMQNWEHIVDIIQNINLRPSKPRNMDISRVRLWYLEDLAKYYRQLIMFTSISVPLVHSFFQASSFNYEGYLTFKHRVDNLQAKLLTSKCKQEFLYYDSTDAKDSCDNRYNFFIKQVLPKYIGKAPVTCSSGDIDGDKRTIDHTLILVSSYFDYVRLRNHFRHEKLSFTQICEYTEDNKVAKARQLFYFGARQFLIYTERCHFYHRYKIKGVRNIIFYEPPVYSKFYSELINMMTPELQGKKFCEEEFPGFVATTLFSNHDTLQLGAIIGYNNAVKLIQSKKSIT